MQKRENKMLIVGVLMLGAYIVMNRNKQIRAVQTNQMMSSNKPSSLPGSVGSGAAQIGVGLVENLVRNMFGNGKQVSTVDAFAAGIVKSPWLISDTPAAQEIAIPDGDIDNVGYNPFESYYV
jgi:hypothetical protein